MIVTKHTVPTSKPKMSAETHALIRRAIAEFAEGRFLLVSDDEDRENEGDLVIAADFATPQAINFMITEGKGLVCLAITPQLAAQKNLKPMVDKNDSPHTTAFTISVDAREEYGMTTGISARERARTIELLISDAVGPEAFCAPGHMFPLVARPKGLLQRTGHTEAGVDLARAAGLTPSSVIVEVIKEDGEMARRDDLIEMSRKWGITYITIRDLCAYFAEERATAREASVHRPEYAPAAPAE
jgi:3,4-dihydroxy 2-butanone 4-phosphate synthase/GTP cyclohydrolase II